MSNGSREEVTDEGTIWLDVQVGGRGDGAPIYARQLLSELDVAASSIACGLGLAQVTARRDIYTRYCQLMDAAGERQKYGLRIADAPNGATDDQ